MPRLWFHREGRKHRSTGRRRILPSLRSTVSETQPRRRHDDDDDSSSDSDYEPIDYDVHRPLPSNVRTILAAGTPECWSLSGETCPSKLRYRNHKNRHSCDSLSLASTSPSVATSLATTEPMPTNSSRPSLLRSMSSFGSEAPQQQGPALVSPLSSKEDDKNNNNNNIWRGSQRQLRKHPSSMIVMYQSPSSSRPDPQQALNMWLDSADALVKSKEMASFLSQTRDVVFLAGGLAVRTAALPVTVPLHLACATKDFVGWTIYQTGALIQHALLPGDPQQESQQHDNPVEALVHTVTQHVLPFVFRLKDEVGATVIGVVTPPRPPAPRSPQKKKQSTEEDQTALDRLRLPVGQSNQGSPQRSIHPQQSCSKADYSKYIMRVEDLGIAAPSSDTILMFVDLSKEYGDVVLLTRCIDKMADRALELATTQAPPIPPAAATDVKSDVEWKAEGCTAKFLRKKSRQTQERWEETISSEVLIWSGSFRKHCGGSHLHRQTSLYLAQGVVKDRSPRQFLELLWDNSRTGDYNHFSMGRWDVLTIEDDVLTKGAHKGTKVVKSETRLPFTSMSVTLLTMMHCRPLPGGPQEGYCIVSRSLVSGMGGYHTTNRHVEKASSEILWGLNIFRAVPGYPDRTELTSLSQVASAMVPKFLGHRVGIMGIEDFFKNVRNPKTTTSADVTATTDAPVEPVAVAQC